MKKAISVLLVIFMLAAFTACGTTPAAKKTDIDLAALQTEIRAILGEDAMTIENDSLSDLYGFEKEDIADAFCLAYLGGAFPEEAIVVKASDEAAAARVKDLLQGRVDDLLTQSENYDAETFEKMKTCKVMTEGNYVALFTALEHVSMESAFEGAFAE